MGGEKSYYEKSRQQCADDYLHALKALCKVCEENVKHAYDRNDQMDIIIAQDQLISVLKLDTHGLNRKDI